MIKKLQKKYALSEQGAKDLIKGCLACVLQNLSFMFPVGLLYYLVSDLMNGGVPGGKIPFYVAGCVVCIGLILLTTFFQYNATYFATYKESGIRRITLAEHLRKIPLSFFGKKDLADLTSTIMADCTFLEQSQRWNDLPSESPYGRERTCSHGVLCQRPCGFVSAETVPYRTEGNSTRVKLSFYYYLEKIRKIGRSGIVNFL